VLQRWLGFMLLIACTNVANLCWCARRFANTRSRFARLWARDRGELFITSVTESVLVSVAGGMLRLGGVTAHHSERSLCYC
jgi:hypothetical protein